MDTRSDLVGEWAASVYLPDGSRYDYGLSLRGDGSYVWRVATAGAPEGDSRGTWRHDPATGSLTFTLANGGPAVLPGEPEAWRTFEVRGWEGSRHLLVLGRATRRYLPVLFYRLADSAAEPDGAPDTGRDIG